MPSRGFITCCNPFDSHQMMLNWMTQYICAGGRLIDTAPMYTEEGTVGAAVRAAGVPRDELWLSTKVPTVNWHALMGRPKEWALKSVEQSLHAMGLTYLDSIFLHMGPAQVALSNSVGPVLARGLGGGMGVAEYVEMWRGLEEARRRGQVRAIGVCMASRREIEALINATGVVPDIAMTWLNPWVPAEQKQYVSWLKSKGIAVQVYGVLNFQGYWGTSKRRRNAADLRLRAAQAAGRRHGATYAQLALQWILDQGLAFITKVNDRYLTEDLGCQGFSTDAEDARILGSVAPWTCKHTLSCCQQLLPGCDA